MGPASTSSLRDLYRRKVVDDETFFWKEGQAEWLSLADLPQLKAKLKPPIPPKPSAVKKAPPLLPRPSLPPAVKPASPATPVQQKVIRNKSISSRSMARASAETNWVGKSTVDGALYYFNPSTEAVAWDKPDVLKTREELETDSGEWVWASDESDVWVPARVVGRSGSSITLQLQSGQRRTVTQDTDKEPLWPLMLSSLRHIEDDLVMMDDLNQGLLMHAVKERYRNDDIYTWVGANHSVLVSVNPFKMLPIYTVSIMEEFSKPSPNNLPPPHTFAIA